MVGQADEEEGPSEKSGFGAFSSLRAGGELQS